jgi:hypothetical protein
VQVYGTNADYSESYAFSGLMASNGGPPGTMYYTDGVPGSEPQSASSYLSLYSLFNVGNLDVQQATGGQVGVLNLPECSAGYGNNPSTGEICGLCPVGTYSTGGTASSCQSCSNAPPHSTYIDYGQTSSNCNYQCDSGYSTNQCLDQLQIFIFNTLTVGGLVGCSLGILFLILAPLLYYRYKRLHDWGDKHNEKGDFFKKVIFLDFGTGGDDGGYKVRSKSTRLDSISNPLRSHANRDLSGDIEDLKTLSIRKLQPKIGKEMRREHRMADSDMVFHACRVNLFGQNSPFQHRGEHFLSLTLSHSLSLSLSLSLHRRSLDNVE